MSTWSDGLDSPLARIEARMVACELALQAIAPWLEPRHLEDALDTLWADFRSVEGEGRRLAIALAMDLLRSGAVKFDGVADDVTRCAR